MFEPAVGIGAAVEYHTEAPIDDFAPTDAATVVQRNPSGTAEGIADNVLHGHIGRETAAVVDIGRFAERRIGTRHIVMVTTQHYGRRNFAPGNGFVEPAGNFDAAPSVGIEDACLRTHHQLILLGTAYPLDVVGHLLLDALRCILPQFFENFGGNTVGNGQIFGFSTGANPAEGAETVVEAVGAHDVFHIGRIFETSVGAEDVCAGPAAFEQEGIAVVEKVGSAFGMLVDGIHLAAQ